MSRPPRPLTAVEQARYCPLCGAQPGERCTIPSGANYPTGTHAARERMTAVPPLRLPAAPTRGQQIAAYFRLLVSLAEKTEDKERRDDLFDRIERTLDEMDREIERERKQGSLGALMADWAAAGETENDSAQAAPVKEDEEP